MWSAGRVFVVCQVAVIVIGPFAASVSCAVAGTGCAVVLSSHVPFVSFGRCGHHEGDSAAPGRPLECASALVADDVDGAVHRDLEHAAARYTRCEVPVCRPRTCRPERRAPRPSARDASPLTRISALAKPLVVRIAERQQVSSTGSPIPSSIPQQMNRMMQCLVLVGLGEGLGSGDEDGSGLGDDAVGVAPVGAGLALRVCAPCGCR